MAGNLKTPKTLSALAFVLVGGVTGAALAEPADATLFGQQLSAATSVDLINAVDASDASAIAQSDADVHHVDEIHHHGDATLAALDAGDAEGSDPAVFNV